MIRLTKTKNNDTLQEYAAPEMAARATRKGVDMQAIRSEVLRIMRALVPRVSGIVVGEFLADNPLGASEFEFGTFQVIVPGSSSNVLVRVGKLGDKFVPLWVSIPIASQLRVSPGKYTIMTVVDGGYNFFRRQ